MDEQMFCFQCEQAAHCTACTGKAGVCGKSADTAAAQDRLTGALISYASQLIGEGRAPAPEQALLLMEGLFTTITNVNFDPQTVDQLTESIHAACPGIGFDYDMANLWHEPDEDIRSLKSFVLFSLRGMAAYNYHARVLGRIDPELDRFFCEALQAVGSECSIDTLWTLVQKTGKASYRCMELLDAANTGAFGDPEPVQVPLTIEKGPFIVISGHDLYDAQQLLEQTAGRGVNVYTHSEMLPAHYYPFFKKYPNFVGNYGNAWWKQKEEFEAFHGPILMTTNCIVPPKDSYKDRLYTTGAAGYPGCPHIPGGIGETKDFSRIIEQAKTCPPPAELETGEIVGGFAHAQVFALADRIVEAVKSGAIRKFVVMGGCDGRAKSRDYYTEFAKSLPKDSVILTAGCAKYKYNKLDLGDIGGIPRVLDAGQCNDSYSLALIALKLQEVFGLDDINDLPIVYNIAWYEQKAVIVLLALLSLGIHNIHLGPTLPAFLSPNVTKVLVEQFGIAGIGSVEEDLRLLIGE